MLQKTLSIVLTIGLIISLSACGNIKRQTEPSASGATDMTDESYPTGKELLQEDPSYKQCINAYQKKIDELLAEDNIDYMQLWNVYTALSYVRDCEYCFKSMLYISTKDRKDGDYPEGDALSDVANAVVDEMRLYFSEDKIEEWNLKRMDRILTWMDDSDVMEVDVYKVEDSRGKVNFDASWENYFLNRVDPEGLAGIYLTESTVELVVPLPNGTQLIDTGEYDAGEWYITVAREELDPDDDIYSFLAFDQSIYVLDELISDRPNRIEQVDGANQYLAFQSADDIRAGIAQSLIKEDTQYKILGCLSLAVDR